MTKQQFLIKESLLCLRIKRRGTNSVKELISLKDLGSHMEVETPAHGEPSLQYHQLLPQRSTTYPKSWLSLPQTTHFPSTSCPPRAPFTLMKAFPLRLLNRASSSNRSERQLASAEEGKDQARTEEVGRASMCEGKRRKMEVPS